MEQLSKDKALQKTISNLRDTSARLDNILANIQPKLSQTATNAEQLTDTLKRQPWRVIFPVTKKYPEDNLPTATPTPTPPPRKAKRVTPKQ